MEDYLERLKSPHMTFYKDTYKNSTRWEKQPLKGKSIIVYCEQGLGDTIQFIRYVSLLKEAKEIIVHCGEELHSLFLKTLPIKKVIAKDSIELPKHDYHVLSMSLPFLFDDPKTQDPYIVVPQKTDLPKTEKGAKIGIAWEGNPFHSKNLHRSCPVSYFKDIKGQLYLLSNGVWNRDLAKGIEEIDLLGVRLKDFCDTACLINALDYVITVDTAVLHLAGAMGKQCFGLLKNPCDERWNVKNWYSSVTLIRGNSWEGIFEKLHGFIKS